MIEAVMFWNEPNNKSHWDFEIDPDWRIFSEMVKLAAEAVHAENPRLLKVLGGISPIDPGFVRNMDSKGVLQRLDVVALHGFPLDWNHWTIHEWPDKIREIREVTTLSTLAAKRACARYFSSVSIASTRSAPRRFICIE